MKSLFYIDTELEDISTEIRSLVNTKLMYNFKKILLKEPKTSFVLASPDLKQPIVKFFIVDKSVFHTLRPELFLVSFVIKNDAIDSVEEVLYITPKRIIRFTQDTIGFGFSKKFDKIKSSLSRALHINESYYYKLDTTKLIINREENDVLLNEYLYSHPSVDDCYLDKYKIRAIVGRQVKSVRDIFLYTIYRGSVMEEGYLFIHLSKKPTSKYKVPKCILVRLSGVNYIFYSEFFKMLREIKNSLHDMYDPVILLQFLLVNGVWAKYTPVYDVITVREGIDVARTFYRLYQIMYKEGEKIREDELNERCKKIYRMLEVLEDLSPLSR